MVPSSGIGGCVLLGGACQPANPRALNPATGAASRSRFAGFAGLRGTAKENTATPSLFQQKATRGWRAPPPRRTSKVWSAETQD